MQINQNYANLKDSYLFSLISKKVENYKSAHPNADIIRLGIGDVTLPLAPAVVNAMKRAVEEMGNSNTFKGYGEEQGYKFLRQAVCSYYLKKEISVSENEIFISDGAKSDLGNILDIFDVNNTVLIPDPVYPVYVDTNIMAGRKITLLDGNENNGFLALPNANTHGDIVYLCSPNNPTGAVYTKDQLRLWVDWANKKNAVILFDSAYESFIQDNNLPTSIYQIEGAKQCAIEFCSLSKTAGFTGVRCGYTIVPQELMRNNTLLNKLWLRRQTTKFNGVPYIVQRGAEAVFTNEGFAQIKKNIQYYLENAHIMMDTLSEMGIWFVGGENSPYIWLKCPNNLSSWEFFDLLLTECNIVGTPGVGFGKNGEGFFRLTAFGKKEHVITAMNRLKNCSLIK